MRSSLIGLVLLLPLAGCLVPDDGVPVVNMGLDAKTAYIHRGMPQNQNEVLQGSAQIILPTRDGASMSVTTWGNLDLTNDKGDAWFPDGSSGHFSELDVIGDYARTIGPVDLTAGLQRYSLERGDVFPNGPRGATNELFVRLSGEALTVKPILELRLDVDEAKGFYANAGVGKDFVLSEKFDAHVGAGLGYSNAKHSFWAYDLPVSGLADLSGEATLGYTYDDHTRLHLTLAGSTMVDSTLRDWFDILGIDRDNVWMGLGVSWSY